MLMIVPEYMDYFLGLIFGSVMINANKCRLLL